MDDYIAKPFTLTTLRARVAYWIARGRDSRPVAAEVPPTVLPTHSTTGHLDLSRLEELAFDEGSSDVAVLLTQIFLEDITKRVRGLRESASAKDEAACLMVAHAIKGACGNFGAVGMAQLAEHAERRCKAHALDEVETISQSLIEEFSIVRGLLESHGLIPDASGVARPRLRRPSRIPPAI
jgi:HPt (histidine-containing phosphotransfer) domain-containing protein